jgi:hypothetical protein
MSKVPGPNRPSQGALTNGISESMVIVQMEIHCRKNYPGLLEICSNSFWKSTILESMLSYNLLNYNG